MRCEQFIDSVWHDQQSETFLVEWDRVYQIYQGAAVILDRMLGIEDRQNIGPLVFGLKLLECIAQMRISEESNGLFAIELSNIQVDTKELQGLVTGKIQMALQETEFIQKYSSQLNHRIGHASLQIDTN